MAMPNQMVAEVEPGTGADTNSGWFATLKADNSTVLTGGTDYTQQASPHVTFDGVTITAATSGASATITITGYTVATTDVANTLRISAGTNFTPGLYQIISVNVGSNTWTMDRNVATGVGAAMVGTMGGALATLSKGFADITASVAVTSGSLNDCTIYYKSGTDTITSGLTIPVQFGLLVSGYQTTRGDNTGTRPLLTTSTNSVNMITAAASTNTSSATFRNVNFSNTAGTRGVGFYAPSGGTGRNVTLQNCKLSGFSYGVFGNFNTNFMWGSFCMFNTEIASSVNDGFNNAGNNFIWGCYIHDNGLTGVTTINPQSTGTTVGYSIIANNTTAGIYFQGGNAPILAVAVNNTIYNNTTAGILIQSTAAPQGGFLIANNILANNGTYGIANNGITSSFYNTGPFNRFNNAFYLNGTAALNGLPADTSDVTLSGSPFVSAGTNFALNNTGGAGAACRAAGFPGAIPGSVGTGYLDIGAVQHQDTPSTTTYIIAPSITNLIQEGVT